MTKVGTTKPNTSDRGDGASGPCRPRDGGTSAQDSERALVDRVLAGDRAAFENFFECYFSRLFRFALVRVNYNEDTAHDVAQNTICKAVRKLETWKGEAPLFSWLCTFCRRELWATNQNHRDVEFAEDSPEICAAIDSLVAGDDSDPELTLRRTETSRLVMVVLDQLPARYGEILECKYIRDLSVKEIATRMRIGPKAAESTLTRAREAFRDLFSAMTRNTAQRSAKIPMREAGGVP